MADILKCESVMDLITPAPHLGKVIFGQEVVAEAHVYQISVSEATWRGLGEPKVLTVAIMAGDQLNNERNDRSILDDPGPVVFEEVRG